MTIQIAENTSPDKFSSKHWLHCQTADGFEMIQISGIALTDFKGAQNGQWHREQLDLWITIPAGIIPQGLAYRIVHWAPFITLNAIYDRSHSVNAGFAVDDFWGPGNVTTFGSIHLYANLAARDKDAYLYRIGYQVTMLGHFVESDIPPVD